jgi:hypothetical protein
MPKSGPVASIVGGRLAGLMDTRVAIAAAGLLLPATPLLLPRQDRARHDERKAVVSSA